MPARAGLLLVARALWLAGWLAARAVLGAWALGRVLWLAAAWSYATVRLGWREAWEASWRGRELEARRLAAGARRG